MMGSSMMSQFSGYRWLSLSQDPVKTKTLIFENFGVHEIGEKIAKFFVNYG